MLVLVGVLAAVPVYAAPTVQLRTPTQNAPSADAGGELSLTFSENVSAVTGNLQVFEADNTLIETVDVAGSKVSVNGATVTINLDNTLAQDQGYYVTIPAGAFNGASGNFAGFTSPSDWAFTTASYSSQSGKLTPPTSFSEYRFGWSVAQDDDWLVIGSYGEQVDGADNVGAAWMYQRDGANWQPYQKLLAPDGGAQDEFGWSVDVDGTTVAVGAWEDESDGSDPGRVYVYVLTGNTWTLQQKIVPNESNALDGFGHEVLLEGDMLFVGAPTDGTFSYGAAYVFNRSGSTWTQTQRLTPTGASGFLPYGFGFALAFDEYDLLVGAPFESTGKGAVYPFTLDNGVWYPRNKATASDGQSGTLNGPFLGDFFGTDISMDGNEAVITAWQDENTSASEGSAYIFTFDGNNWIEGEKLLPNEDDHDGFGYQVKIVNNTLIVGADVDGIVENPVTGNPLPGGSGDESGVIYIFVRDFDDDDSDANTDWLLFDKIEPDDNDADDYYGNQFAFDGTTAYIGAWGDDDAGTSVGAVYETLINFTPSPDLVLVNADTEASVRSVIPTDTIDLATAPTNWNLRADILQEGVKDVTFTLSGDAAQQETDSSFPYTFPVDGNALNLAPGSYTLFVAVDAFGGNATNTQYLLTVKVPPNPADVNGDSFITPADAVMALNRLGTSDPDADVDANGTVETVDVDLILALLGTTD